MNSSLPRLDNLAIARGASQRRPQILYGVRVFPPRRTQQPLTVPARLIGTQLSPREASYCRFVPSTRNSFPQFSYKQANATVATVTSPLLVDLFGYRPLMEHDVKQNTSTLEYTVSSQSIGTVDMCSSVPEKVMLSTFSRPPSSLRGSRISATSIKSIAIPSLNDALTGPLSSSRARPNSARKIETPTSLSRSPSPSCLNKDFIHSQRVLSHAGQRSIRTVRDLAKDTVSGGTSLVYSLGLPRESPRATETPIYEIPAQFFLQNNSPLRKSPLSNESCPASPSIDAEISLAEGPGDISASSIDQQDASEPAHTADHVIMDQPVHCKRPVSVPHINHHAIEIKAPLPSQHSIRRCTSACSSQPILTTRSVEKVTRDQKQQSNALHKGKTERYCPRVRERLMLSTTLLHNRTGIPPLYRFKVSAQQSTSALENSQLSRLVSCTSVTEYINGLLDRRGFYPYGTRHAPINL